MHTVPYEGSVGLVNLLTTTRVLRKGFDTNLVLYGPGVLMASGTRGFPKVGDEAFPGHMAINNQIRRFLDEGGTVYACRFACGALYGFPEDLLMDGVTPFHPLDVLDAALTAWRDRPSSSTPGRCSRRSRRLEAGRWCATATRPWRRGGAPRRAIYPTVMVNAGALRAVPDDRAGDRRGARRRAHRRRRWSTAWHERRDLAIEVVAAHRAEHARVHGPRPRCATRRSATATARSRASAARRSRASAWSRRGARRPSGSCSSRT